MNNNKLPSLLTWMYHKDGTLETTFPSSKEPPTTREDGEEELHQKIPAKRELLDIDKLIEESDGLYGNGG